MSNVLAQDPAAVSAAPSTTINVTFAGAMTNGSYILSGVTCEDNTATVTVSDNKNAGNHTQDVFKTQNGGGGGDGSSSVYNKKNTQTAAATVTATFSNSSFGFLKTQEWTGIDGTTPLDATGSNNGTSVAFTCSATTLTANCTVIAASTHYGNGATADTGYTAGYTEAGLSNAYHFGEYNADVGAAGAKTITMNLGTVSFSVAMAAYKPSGGPVAANVGQKLWAGPGISPNRQTQFQSRPLAVTNDRSVGLTGQSATFTPGTLTAVITPLSIGQGRITGPGISPDYLQLFKAAPRGFTTPSTSDVTVALTGQNATFTAGTLTANLSVALTGQSGTFVAGTLSPAIDKVLSGQSAAFSPGTLAPAIDVALLGQNATFATGIMTGQATGDVTVALSGIQATFITGQMIATGADAAQISSGGFFYDFGEHIQQRRKKRQEIKEARDAEESIEEEIDRNISRLMHEQEEKDAERKDLERIRALVKKYNDVAPIEINSERVQKAIVAVQKKATFANAERLQREFERMLEEEEHAVLMLLASLD